MNKKTKELGAWWQFSRVIAGWSTLTIVLVSALALGANRPVSWSMLALAIAIIYIFQLFQDIFTPFPENGRGIWAPASLFIGAMVWAFVQIWPGVPLESVHPVWSLAPDATASISATPGQGRHAIMRILCYAMVFWIALRAAADRDRAHTFLKVIALFSTCLAIYGFYAVLMGTNPILGIEDLGRALSATFVNRNSYATYAAFGAFANLAVYLSVSEPLDLEESTWRQMFRNGLERFFGGTWLYVMGIVICTGAVAMSQSRAGSISCLLGFIAFIFAWQRRSTTGNVFLIFGLIGVIFYIGWVSSTGLGARLFATSAEDGRFAVYPDIIDAISERPLLGHGLGAFPDTFRAHVTLDAAFGEWNYAHSTYLENAYELGLPAAGVFFVTLLLIGWRVWRGSQQRRRDRVFPCFAFACFVTAAFHSTVDFSLQMPATAALFMFIMGMGWSQSFPRRSSRSRLHNKVE